MARLIIDGLNRLSGEVRIQGAKNSALPILAASILANGQSLIENCPNLSDTDSAGDILTQLGCKVKREKDIVLVNSDSFNDYVIPDNLMRQMRSSVMFLGAILGRAKKAKISMPGGCELGPRPIDIHLSSLMRLGVKISDESGFLLCECPNGLNGADITMSFPSVGATENVMLAASVANGITLITNAAREPEIEDLQNFLNQMGAKISGAGTNIIRIDGVPKLHPAHHMVIPDRIVAATYIIAAYATGGRVRFNNVNPSHLSSVLALLSDAGCNLNWGSNYIELKESAKPRALKNIRTMPYPGFPTDIQAPLMALMTIAEGTSIFVETIFDNRYKHAGELMRLGANIQIKERVAVVEGVKELQGALVEATDLRGGAALVVAGLCAKGQTIIDKVFHIDRGYDKIEEKLASLGANIKRMNDEL
jgi:UDP-N-acetylglucosamine 1-carboxyvinyltransferase